MKTDIFANLEFCAPVIADKHTVGVLEEWHNMSLITLYWPTMGVVSNFFHLTIGENVNKYYLKCSTFFQRKTETGTILMGNICRVTWQHLISSALLRWMAIMNLWIPGKHLSILFMLYSKTPVWILHQHEHKLNNYDKCDHAFKCSLNLFLFQSRWQLDRKRNRKRLKYSLLLSFLFKDKYAYDHFPQCSLHTDVSLISGYEKAQESNRQLPQPGGREKKRWASLFSVSTTYSTHPPHSLPHSLSLVALHLQEASGFIYPNPGRPEDPCALSGCRVWASVWVLVVEKKSFGLPTSLSGPSQNFDPPLPLLPQASDPSQMPWSMVSVALHLNWKILNRFIQKLFGV